jgi:integrase/recombinase XerD
MALNLYRRHRRDCKAGHLEESRSGEFEERKKNWKRCDCPIFASGTLSRKFRRQTTGRWEWDDAKAIGQAWEATGSWYGASLQPHTSPTAANGRERTTVEYAIKAFLAEREEVFAANTYRKNKFVLNTITAFSSEKGYVLLDQWQPMDIRDLRSSWSVSQSTSLKYMEIVKAFFRFCHDNKWIEENPAKAIRPVKSKADRPNERVPFSDAELTRMYDACHNLYPKGRMYTTTGQDLADFIAVSVYTGLRISDVSTFHIDRLKENGECHVRTTKTARKVFTWIPVWLQERIRDRVKTSGPLIFGAHQTEDINVITDLWRRKLNRLWSLCGPWSVRPTPHRTRHTFARILLQKPGVTVRDVAELMGDTEDTILKFYGSWVEERQTRLTTILREAFEEKPKPKLLTIR